jgi:hypothetical protein
MWIQGHCGETMQTEVETSYSDSNGKGGSNHTESVAHRTQIRHAVMGSTMMTLPPTSEESGLTAMHDMPEKQLERTKISSARMEEILEAKVGGNAIRDPDVPPAQFANESPWADLVLESELVTPRPTSPEEVLKTISASRPPTKPGDRRGPERKLF